MHETTLLETDRLLLRSFTLDDLDDLYSLYASPTLMRYIMGKPRTYELTQARLERHMADHARYGFGLWATVLKQNNQFIGRCGLEPIWVSSEHQEGELQGDIAWMFKEAYWGRGLATEFGDAMIEYGFTTLGLHRIFATAHMENRASIRVMEKLDMRYVSTSNQRVEYELISSGVSPDTSADEDTR